MNTCVWCNSSVADDKTIWVRKNLLIGYPFCSNRCSSQWKENKNANSNESKESNNSVSDSKPIEEYHGVSHQSSRSSQSFEDVLAEARMVSAQHQIETQKQAAIDKSNKEFFDSLKKNWKIVVTVVIVLVIGIAVFSHFNGVSKQNDIKMSQQLEKIEDKVRLSIQSGDKKNALDLTNQLVHPSHKDMETQKFDTWHGYPKYDEYWAQKREKYKEQILKLN